MQFGPRTLLFFMLLLAMPVVAYFLLFKPFNARIDAVKAHTAEKQQTLQDLAKKVSRTRDMGAEIKKLHEVVSLLEHRLPAAKETENVYNEVWNYAVKNHLDVKSVHMLAIANGPSYSKQSFRMVINGPMKDGFYKFLSDVEWQLKRLTRITDMTITADDKNPGNVIVDMTMAVYFENGEKLAVAQ